MLLHPRAIASDDTISSVIRKQCPYNCLLRYDLAVFSANTNKSCLFVKGFVKSRSVKTVYAPYPRLYLLRRMRSSINGEIAALGVSAEDHPA